MLLSMCFDDDDETAVTALFQVGDQVLQLKQKPNEGRVYDKDKEEKQEYAMAHPEEDFHPSSASGQYDSAFPNVGLVVWQSGFVLGEYLLRTKPLGSWNKPLRVLELGCGTGQLGIVLALAGADVTLTDLEHITPLTQVNIDLNIARCAVQPTVMPYMWGTDTALLQAVGGKQWQQQQEVSGHSSIQQQQEPVLQQQQQPEPLQQQPWDLIVAADVLYEPQHYDELLQSLTQLCPMPSVARDITSNGADDQQLNAAVGALHISQEEQQSHEEIEQLPLNSNMLSPPIYICYRVRRYGEHGFENKAIKCGFEVSAVPIDDLHADYRCGGYRLIRLDRKH